MLVSDISCPVCFVLLNSQRLQVELQESEQRYRQMFREHAAVKLLIDPKDGAIIQANSSVAQFYGYPMETLESMN